MGALRNFRTLIMVATILLDILVVSLASHSLQQSQKQYELRAQTQTQNVALAIDNNLSYTIDKIDLVLRISIDELELQLATGGIKPQQMSEFLARQRQRFPNLMRFGSLMHKAR